MIVAYVSLLGAVTLLIVLVVSTVRINKTLRHIVSIQEQRSANFLLRIAELDRVVAAQAKIIQEYQVYAAKVRALASDPAPRANGS